MFLLIKEEELLPNPKNPKNTRKTMKARGRKKLACFSCSSSIIFSSFFFFSLNRCKHILRIAIAIIFLLLEYLFQSNTSKPWVLFDHFIYSNLLSSYFFLALLFLAFYFLALYIYNIHKHTLHYMLYI